MSEYILSVAVPSYNVEKYLDKCLTSFSDGRFCGKVDVMIVNDGSVDSTPQIAEKYVEKYPDIFRLINKKNGGHGSAVNCGIENAKGKYFRIVDGDDWVDTENTAKLLDILENTDADLVVDEKSEVDMATGKETFCPLPGGVEFGKEYLFEDICDKNDICTYIMLHTLSVKTELLHKNNIRLLEKIFYVDIEFIIKATVEAKTALFTDLAVYKYLVGNANQSMNCKNLVKNYSHHEKVTKEIVRFGLERNPANEHIKNYLDRRVILLLNSHYNIPLIFDDDRKRGLSEAKEFRSYLEKTAPRYAAATKKRYAEARILHFFGVDGDKLAKLKGRKG